MDEYPGYILPRRPSVFCLVDNEVEVLLHANHCLDKEVVSTLIAGPHNLTSIDKDVRHKLRQEELVDMADIPPLQDFEAIFLAFITLCMTPKDDLDTNEFQIIHKELEIDARADKSQDDWVRVNHEFCAMGEDFLEFTFKSPFLRLLVHGLSRYYLLNSVSNQNLRFDLTG